MNSTTVRPSVTIKLKPYLQEFLKCKLQQAATMASTKHFIGATIAPLLEYSDKNTMPQMGSGPEYISFELPHWIGGKNIRNHSVYMPEKNQEEFQRILSMYFREVFYQYVDDKIRFQRQAKKCILSFCTYYNISFDRITFEMLKKSYYRYRKKKKNRLFLA